MKKLLALALLFAATSAVARSKDAYILTTGGRNISALISGDMSIGDVKAYRAQHGGSFLWVRRDGRSYLIHDHDFLAQAEALFAPVKELEPEQRRIAAEEAKLDAEADSFDDVEETPAVRDRLREIERKQRDVAAREREIDRREEEIEKRAEDALWRMVDRAIEDGIAVRDR